MIDKYNSEQIEASWKRYVTDSLQVTAMMLTGNRDIISWTDIVDDMKKTNKPESGKETLAKIRNKFNKWLGGEEE